MKAYLHRNGQTYGPYPEESLRGFIESGHAGPSDLVCAVGDGEWVCLGDLLGMKGEGAEEETLAREPVDEEVLENAGKARLLVQKEESRFAQDLVLG